MAHMDRRIPVCPYQKPGLHLFFSRADRRSGEPVLLADGMGGYQAGDYASWYAVEGLVSYMKEQKGIPVVTRFREGISQVNGQLFQKAQNSPEYKGMGTTLVAASAQEQTMYGS